MENYVKTVGGPIFGALTVIVVLDKLASLSPETAPFLLFVAGIAVLAMGYLLPDPEF
ncbi:hypothetical protein [Halorubrum ezzemoulense]|uniref:hypothetical protein n=1 Tax=Halorubrum ezzemoulense TaxID=337243 RepID=UPI0015C5C15E|nr:hypothetical protein [Halorubrum ezzemoulense]